MGKHPGLYEDLSKRSNDLLTKEFPSEKQENKFVWKGIASNGVNFETTMTQKKDGSTVGIFAPKYKHVEWNTTFSAELTTKRDFKAEVAAEDLLGVDGLKTTVTAESHNASKAEQFATVELQYKHELATTTLSGDFGKEDGTLVKGSAVFGNAIGAALGVSTAYHLGTSEFQDLSTSLAYRTVEFDTAAFGRFKSIGGKSTKDVGVNYFQRVNPNMLVGAEAVFDVNGSRLAKVTFASNYALDKDTSVKGKYDTDGRLSLSYTQQFSKAKLTAATTIDTLNLNAKNSSVLGFTLNLSS